MSGPGTPRPERILPTERETVCDMWRSSVSEGIEERDRLRAHIATLEREVAEARQREEDATDLILRLGEEVGHG